MEGIIGREAELAEIGAFVEAAPHGPGALVLEGEPGIGKSILWDSSVARAEELGLRVLRCRPAESEAGMAYSVWTDLFRDIGDEELASLPEPQRVALEIALIRSGYGDARVEQMAVSAATLGVLRSLGERSPVLVAIDDQQWVDRESSRLIGYCARRLRDEAIRLLACGRSLAGRRDPLGLGTAMGEDRFQYLAVQPLTVYEIALLLERRLRLTLPYATIRRIHDAVRGNPLYALEVGRAILEDPGRWGEHEMPVPAEVRDLVHARVVKLAPAARELVEVSSACARPTSTLLASVLDRGTMASALEQAGAAGVLTTDGDDVRFVHPLFAAAAYSGMSLARRREVHARLAEVVPDESERAHHLALGSEPPDEVVASALEAQAARTARRGAPNASAELFEEAARFTPGDRGDAITRLWIHSAAQHTAAGDHPRAVELLEKALASMPAGADRAEALTALGRLMFYWDLPRAREVLREAELQEAGAAVLSEVHRVAAWVGWHLLDRRAALDHARAALRFAEQAGDAKAFVQAVATADQVERAAGLRGDRALLDRAVEIEGSVQDLSASDGARFALAAALREDGRFAEARVIFRSLLDEVRERGDELDVTNMLLNLYELEYAAGDWDASLAYAREMYEFDVQVGYPSVIPLSTIAMIEGHRGAFDHARTHVREALASVQTHAAQLHGIRELDALIAAGTVELAAGDVAAAVGPLAEASATFLGSAWGSSVGGWFLADVAEALIGCDRAAEVQPLTTWLEEKAPALSDATALALVARIRGLVAASKGDHGQAIRELERAVEHHERVEVPFERARTLLALGTVRRHAKQKAAAREALQQAESVFERLGATPWADRARQELAAIGGRAPSTGRLTPTEDRVARLAAVGRTNREIANALFLSVRTVEGHLSHIYAKLGVRSRTELAVVLAPDPETT